MLPNIAGLPSYSLGHILAVVLFTILIESLLRRRGIGVRHTVCLSLCYLFANYFAAKILYYYVIGHGKHTIFDQLSPAHFSEGGLWGWHAVFFPLALGYAAMLAPPRRGDLLRAVSLALPPVIAVQELSCFAAGCTGGRPTSLPWAVVFPVGSLCPTPGVPVHPVQLYDVSLALAVFGVLLAADRRGGGETRPFLFPAFVGLYALGRFVNEFFRADAGYEPSLSRWFEAAAFIAMALLLLFGRAAWRRFILGPNV